MTTFHYVALRDDLEIRGVLASESKRAAFQRLLGEGFSRIRVRPAHGNPTAFLHRIFAAGRRMVPSAHS